MGWKAYIIDDFVGKKNDMKFVDEMFKVFLSFIDEQEKQAVAQ